MNWLNIIDKVKANCCNSVRLTTGNYRYSHTNRYNNAFIYFDCETLSISLFRTKRQCIINI